MACSREKGGPDDVLVLHVAEEWRSRVTTRHSSTHYYTRQFEGRGAPTESRQGQNGRQENGDNFTPASELGTPRPAATECVGAV
jgi:hypothetical protein